MPRHAAMEEGDGGDLEKATVVVALEQLERCRKPGKPFGKLCTFMLI